MGIGINPHIKPIRNINGMLISLIIGFIGEKRIIEAHSVPIAMLTNTVKGADVPNVTLKRKSTAKSIIDAIIPIVKGVSFLTIADIIKIMSKVISQFSTKNPNDENIVLYKNSAHVFKTINILEWYTLIFIS